MMRFAAAEPLMHLGDKGDVFDHREVREERGLLGDRGVMTPILKEPILIPLQCRHLSKEFYTKRKRNEITSMVKIAINKCIIPFKTEMGMGLNALVVVKPL